MTDAKKFKEAFKDVTELGFVKTNRAGNTGIGKTLEDIMGVPENNIDAPDLHGFEIKGQRAFSGSYVTLFTRAPTWPKAANTFLRQTYGTADKRQPEMKVLHTSMFADRYNTHKSGYSFKLNVDRTNEKIQLVVKNMQTQKLENLDIYWTFEVINKILTEKLNKLVYVTAQTEKRDDGEYFHFNKADMYFGTSLETFLTMLEGGEIMFDIRIGVYRQGKSKGKSHDHGSGFRLKKGSFASLFDTHDIISEL